MLIWDEVNKRHIVRIKGKVVGYVEPSKVDFNKTETNIAKDIESGLKTTLDADNIGKDYHLYFHTYSKDSLKKELDYSVWLGSKNAEPRPDWYVKSTEIISHG